MTIQAAFGNFEPTTGNPLVHAEGVSKWYGQVSGLNNVTVSIPPGITGLLGPNGAGKSTFMKLMSCQMKPIQGKIRVLGEPIWGNPAVFARIIYQVKQWLMQLREIRDLGRPIVHLRVYVDRVLTVPRRLHLLVPLALKIRRHGAGTTAGN